MSPNSAAPELGPKKSNEDRQPFGPKRMSIDTALSRAGGGRPRARGAEQPPTAESSPDTEPPVEKQPSLPPKAPSPNTAPVDTTRKGMAALGRQLAGLATKVITNLPPVRILILIALIGAALLLLLAAIIGPSLINWGASGTGGKGITVPAKHVENDTEIKQLLALAGDLKAKQQLIGETAEKLRALLDTIEQNIAAGELSSGKNKDETLAQLGKTRVAINTLVDAVKQANQLDKAATSKKTNQRRLPKYVLDARTRALRELANLLKLLGTGAVDCNGLGSPNAAGFVAFPKSAAYKIDSPQKWAKPQFVCAIMHIAADYKALYPSQVVILHDASGELGNWPGNRHLSHIRGTDIDVWFQGATLNSRWNPSLPASYDVEKAQKLAEIIAKYKYGDAWIGFDDCEVARYAKEKLGFHLGGERTFPTFECETAAYGFGDHTTHWHIGFRNA